MQYVHVCACVYVHVHGHASVKGRITAYLATCVAIFFITDAGHLRMFKTWPIISKLLISCPFQ